MRLLMKVNLESRNCETGKEGKGVDFGGCTLIRDMFEGREDEIDGNVVKPLDVSCFDRLEARKRLDDLSERPRLRFGESS